MAVLSRGLDSATADGWSIPPAPETVTAVVGLESGIPDVCRVGATIIVLTTDVELGVGATFVVSLLGTDAVESAKVNAWFGSAELQGAWSITLAAVTVKQVPTAFEGDKAKGPAPPLNGKVWEFVTAPPMRHNVRYRYIS